jgi:hypothetical protein
VHDFQRVRQDLHESLSLDKHPVALLIGAGCPVAVRVPNPAGTTDPLIPDVAGLTAAIKHELCVDTNFVSLLKQFTDDGRTTYTIEDLLSHVRLLRRIVGAGDARGLDAKSLEALETALCKHVADAVRKELPGPDSPYHQLADWIGGVPRKSPLQLFTTNYDLLVEQALEDKGLPFFDGFVGSRRPFFDLRAIEDDPLPARWTRLWKLHGCVSWRLIPDGQVIRTHQDVATGDGLLIHPSELKYDQSRRMPYLAMIDRLRHFLRQPSAFLVTIGYSYTDEHLNEVVLQGLRSNPMAAAFGLLYKNLSEEPGAAAVADRLPANLTLVARDQGVARGVRGIWLPDSSSGASLPISSDLGDFAVFAKFLKELCAAPRGATRA